MKPVQSWGGSQKKIDRQGVIDRRVLFAFVEPTSFISGEQPPSAERLYDRNQSEGNHPYSYPLTHQPIDTGIRKGKGKGDAYADEERNVKKKECSQKKNNGKKEGARKKKRRETSTLKLMLCLCLSAHSSTRQKSSNVRKTAKYFSNWILSLTIISFSQNNPI